MENILLQGFRTKLFKFILVLFLVAVSTISYIYTNMQNKTKHSFIKLGNSKQEKIQQERLKTMVTVCEKYKEHSNYFSEYVEKPGGRIRGKFTMEPKSKLVMCNTMKQGTTTWARIFLQMYLPRAVNWRKQSPKFSPFSVGYQVKLQEMQRKKFSKNDRQVIMKSLEESDHDNFAFFVCRNPIERLKSLYGYSLDLGRFKKGKTPSNFKDFIKYSFSHSSPLSINIHEKLIAEFSLFQFIPSTPCFPCVLPVPDIMMQLSRWKHSLMTQGLNKNVWRTFSDHALISGTFCPRWIRQTLCTLATVITMAVKQ